MLQRSLLGVVAATALLPAAAVAQPATERVSVSSQGGQLNSSTSAAAISPDGRYAAFVTNATNLKRPKKRRSYLMLRDREAGTTVPLTVAESFLNLQVSAGGRFVAFDRRNTILVRNVARRRNSRVSVLPSGRVANPYADELYAISDDGLRVAFAALGRGHLNAYVRLRAERRTVRANVKSDGSGANGDVRRVTLSGNGQVVAFSSDSTNLVPDDTNELEDVFVRDLAAGTTTRVSVSSSGEQANAGEGEFAGTGSSHAALSADGRYVAFSSYASNLVPGDTNAEVDVFVHDRVTGETRRVSVASDGAQADGFALSSDISGDGRIVLFESNAPNLVPGDSDDRVELFAHDTATGATVQVVDDQVEAATLSADGSLVSFLSGAAGLVAGDTNNRTDAFVRGPFEWGAP
jgi:Tol biopolymer transport system component